MTTMTDDVHDRALHLRARARRMTHPAMAYGQRSAVPRRNRETRWRQGFLLIILGILLGATGFAASTARNDDDPAAPIIRYAVTERAPVRTGGS